MKNIVILFGGKSVEHEVSLVSASNIIKAIGKDFKIIPVGITKNGDFLLFQSDDYLLNAKNGVGGVKLNIRKGHPVIFSLNNKQELICEGDKLIKIKIDVVFPVLHGGLGEDGSVQGLLKLTGAPFVGPNILDAAICMDKDVSKRLLKEGGIKISDYKVFKKGKEKINFDNIIKELGSQLFVKPANSGSSVGVNRVFNKKTFYSAVSCAFKYDNKIIIEKAVVGREIECAILGGKNPRASIPGEIMAKDNFYSYRAKYIDKNGADLIIPAKLSRNEIKLIQEISLRAFDILNCEIMARVDGFLCDEGYYINEVNTIPGFTNISMYPKLWEISGFTYKKLINELIALAFERQKMLNNLNNDCVG
jgi:D-alanine-D-alanine ligase